MPQVERRYDKLAVRLCLIISRLVTGETLNLRKLAIEFGVSVRTLRRDFHERLMYLDLDYHNGNCRLLSGNNVVRRDHVALAFARQSGVAGLFPGLDNRLVNILLESGDESPCFIWPPSTPVADACQGHFHRLASAINTRRRITLLAEGQRCERLAPYRLISVEGCWYITGEASGRIIAFPLAEVRAVTVSSEDYTRDETVSRLICSQSFITALPHFRFIGEVLTTFSTESLVSPEN